MAEKTFNGVKVNVEFTQADTRENIKTGENISKSFGKISKTFNDLTETAFTDIDEFALAGHDHDDTYLPLTGGTLSSNSYGPLTIERSGTANTAYAAAIKFTNNNGVLGGIGMDGTPNTGLKRFNADEVTGNYIILDTGNYMDYRGIIRTATARGDDVDVSSKPWFKIAESSTDSTFFDMEALFLVNNTHGERSGILKLRARTEATAGVFGGTRTLYWQMADDTIVPEDFVMVCIDGNDGIARVELWCNISYQYNAYSFVLIDESTRIGTSVKSTWTLYKSASGYSSYTTGTYTHVSSLCKLQNDITGNAGTATKLTNQQDVSIIGDISATGSFDGSSPLALTASLVDSGVTAGSYGPTKNVTPAHAESFEVPQITVDEKGRVTHASTKTVTLPNVTTGTDTKVNVKLATTSKAYLLGTSTSPTSTPTGVTAVADTGVYLDTIAGRLSASSFKSSSSDKSTIIEPGSIKNLPPETGEWLSGIDWLTPDASSILYTFGLFGKENPSTIDDINYMYFGPSYSTPWLKIAVNEATLYGSNTSLSIRGDGTSSSSLKLHRSGGASWDIINSSGDLHIQNNWVDGAKGDFFDVLKLSNASGNATFKGTVTAPKFIGDLQGNADTADSADVATQVYSTSSTLPSTGVTYAIAFHEGITTGNKSLLNNDNFRLQMVDGTTTTEGRARIHLGNNVASGTAGNATGMLLMFSDTSHYGVLRPVSGLPGDRTWNLPNASGTIALTSDLSKYLPLTGNAVSSSKLETPVTINGVEFDGSVDISLAKVLYDGAGTTTAVRLVEETTDYDALYVVTTYGSGLVSNTGGQFPYAQTNLLGTLYGSKMGSISVTVSGTVCTTAASNYELQVTSSNANVVQLTSVNYVAKVIGLKWL